MKEIVSAERKMCANEPCKAALTYKMRQDMS